MASRKRCPHCGSSRLVRELRDPVDSVPPEDLPPEAYGEWIVCEECGREWKEGEGG